MLIGEVARRSGVSARMLRHYESLGLVRPTGRTGGGYRNYSGEDIRRILHIESLRSLGLSLPEVRRALDDPGFSPAGLVGELIRRTEERIAAETRLLTRLRRTRSAEPAGWTDVLQVVALLQALGSDSARKRQRAALSSGDRVTAPVEALVEAVLKETDPNVAGALRWVLAQTGADGPALLTEALGSPVAGIRRRAVEALAELPAAAATAALRDALTHSDVVVRRRAAAALGSRGEPGAVPVLLDMIVEGANDVEAADALAVLARDPTTADRIAAQLAALLSGGATDPAVLQVPTCTADPATRRRLTQALAEIPGDVAAKALGDVRDDDDRAVALTAVYVLSLREQIGGPGRAGS